MQIGLAASDRGVATISAVAESFDRSQPALSRAVHNLRHERRQVILLSPAPNPRYGDSGARIMIRL